MPDFINGSSHQQFLNSPLPKMMIEKSHLSCYKGKESIPPDDPLKRKEN
jgi:hypothetical protein